ncbi:bifunctional phosphoribosyl-AMP cyclohydrolase/phosphoribosyl-ATP diphosphatase HisIE [Paenibacillus alvei]|uniref:bifunctional phosphoribosyl-AMP cyclohydrolase/phosphoribosyl-ATP diphosphatase HisIE n=1 Tax=Paenibacillus alvei TaxID=44250 RepID=UPI0022816493|nr:bifunctional phosphoribosyl-AMP cyclohydrolase/phosphoribosyl-ATP diphosphatase HisIE [Paenibacillus alvei]MCY7484365.1 bifunctional phosphoribosyl-AMP cyclohydrolase/phosphoribosyl-ATP diphosphatase HisIE [Paenibacillus alvei]
MTQQVMAAGERLVNLIRWNDCGLVPTVVQDSETKDVLMVAYMNRESLLLSCKTGETIFWSRSRQELWHKGATSGNTQQIVSMSVDCDQDTLLVQVRSKGPACHTGSRTCFDNAQKITAVPEADKIAPAGVSVLSALENLLAQRQLERPEGSYTTYLFEKGLDKILKKIGEEATEVVIAAKSGDKTEMVGEIGDLLFHVLVLLRERDIALADVLSELEIRHSGPRRDTYNEQGKVKS